MQNYEVEIKALLGTPERAQEVRDALMKADPATILTSRNTQLNHYFEGLPGQGGTLDKLAEAMKSHLSPGALSKLEDFANRANKYSVRTRDKDGTVLLVVKASVGDDSSENGVSRMELEEEVPMTIDELDAIVLSAGFSYQAKWSRAREEYLCNGINVCLDKNAGYGYLAEFEHVVDDESKVDEARRSVEAFMQSIGVKELPQDRLERMFAHYNANWPEYYGTDKIFTIE
jgi:predicted adenylyl cyclase CyaB